MDAFFRDATEEDCYELAPNLRPLDLREMQLAQLGEEPAECLVRCMKVSDEAHAVIVDGVCVGIFGVVKIPFGGSPWFLCSENMRGESLKVVRQGRKWVEEMTSKYGILSNICLLEHQQSLDFIEVLGFALVDVIQHKGADWQVFIKGAEE